MQHVALNNDDRKMHRFARYRRLATFAQNVASVAVVARVIGAGVGLHAIIVAPVAGNRDKTF
jgi:hypothetical protein